MNTRPFRPNRFLFVFFEIVPLFLLLGCNLIYIVDLLADLHELASASARTLLKLASSVRALLKPWLSHLKVAEHSFRARSCWCDSARAQGLQKQTCRWYSDHFICSTSALSLLFFFVIERSVLMALVLYNKGMLEKVTTQRTQQFSDFSKSKEPS